MIKIEDLTKKNLEDIFKICSYNKLDDTLQQKGIKTKRKWLLKTLQEHGPCTKIAYFDDRPVAQILFYPEKISPFLPNPRDGVIKLHCVYSPFHDYQKKRAGTSLLRNLIQECYDGLPILKRVQCSCIVSYPFTTGEGLNLEEFYKNNGFVYGNREMYLEINGVYNPLKPIEYDPLPEDKGRAIIFYDPLCEWGYPFAKKIENVILNINPSINVKIFDKWKSPSESLKRGNQQLIVNAIPIASFWTEKEKFRKEIEDALSK